MRPLLLSAAINFAFGMTPGSRIDNFGHLGGFLGGLAISFLVGPRYKTVGYDRFGRCVSPPNSQRVARIFEASAESNSFCSSGLVLFPQCDRARLVDEPFYKTLLQKVRERY